LREGEAMSFSLPCPEQYVFITPVWGEKYVERYVKVSLRTQLSEGNLGGVPPGKGLYLIYTFRENVRAIVRSAAYRQLKSMMPVSIRSLDDLPRFGEDYPHDLQTAAYIRGIKAAAGREAAFIFLTPDILLGDGAVRTLIRRTESGSRVVLAAGVRMTSEGAIECVSAHRTPGRADAPVPPRALVRGLLDNLHPISRGHLVEPNGTVHIAQHLYWSVGDHGLLARGFHIHPLLVWPRNPDAGIYKSLDEEYVERACPDPADWHTVTDSDELCILEFSERRHKLEMLAGPPIQSEEKIIAFMEGSTNATHRRHVLHHLRFHTRGTDSAEWADLGEQSDRLVNRFLKLFAAGPSLARVEVVDSVPAPPAPSPWKLVVRALVRRLYFLLNYPLYQYVGRLNAEIVHLRKVGDQNAKQLDNVSRILNGKIKTGTKAPVRQVEAISRAQRHRPVEAAKR
jgi:hypothetical protein